MDYNFESEREMGVETKTGFKSIQMIGKGSGIKGRKNSRTAEFLLCGTEEQTQKLSLDSVLLLSHIPTPQ